KCKTWHDIQKVHASHRMELQGKMRTRCHIQHRGPCIINNEDKGIIKAFRGIPAITLLNVSELNILKIAPGGHVGCVCIGTSVSHKLDYLFDTRSKAASLKSNYNLPMHTKLNTEPSNQIRMRFQARSLWERRKGRRLLVEKAFGGKKAAATKKPAAEKPTENKPTTEEKKLWH
uniref:Uncharacterized protein n=1 Tax=Myotis lucifugus TaxID=59463 RepID=G1Q709_MYOLU